MAALNAQSNLPEDSLGKLKDASLLINFSDFFLGLLCREVIWDAFLPPFAFQFVLEIHILWTYIFTA